MGFSIITNNSRSIYCKNHWYILNTHIMYNLIKSSL